MIVIEAIVGFVLALCGALVVFDSGARRLFDYTLMPNELTVRLLGRVTVYRIALADIVNADLWHFSFGRIGTIFTTLRLGNRIFGRAVVIERRSGFPRYIIFTPDDPVEVVTQLRAPIRR